MPQVKIEEKGCRGCTLCVDICPADVFEYNDDTKLATVPRQDDCIGCFSCFYICPSQCVELSDVHIQRPFYRLEENVALVKKFLQAKETATDLTTADWEEAHKDVVGTLVSLSKAIVESVGRGTKALGRKAGIESAAHLPEMYEASTIQGVLDGIKRRFANSLDFEYQVSGQEVKLSLDPCGLCAIVEGAGDKVGDSVMCHIYHSYLGGLLSAYTGTNYACEVVTAGKSCELKLSA